MRRSTRQALSSPEVNSPMREGNRVTAPIMSQPNDATTTTATYSSKLPVIDIPKIDSTIEFNAEKSNLDSLDEGARERLIGNAMRALLYANQNLTKMTTGKLKSIVVNETTNLNSHGVAQLLREAQLRFADLVGYELVSGDLNDVDPSNKNSNKSAQQVDKRAGKGGTNETWFLVNKLGTEHINLQANRQGNPAKSGFLLTVLSLIVLEGGGLSESTLWEKLQDLGIARPRGRKSAVDPQLGDTDQVLKSLVAEAYLRKVVLKGVYNNEDKQEYMFHVGKRTVMSVGVDNIVRFIVQTTGIAISEMEIRHLLQEVA